MNAAQIHLALNHLPIGLLMVGVPLLLIALMRRSKELRVVAVVLYMLAAVTTVPVFLSGEPAEEIVEHRPGVSERVIHEHEEMAEVTLIIVAIAGIFGLGAWLFERLKTPAPRSVWFALLFVGFVNLGLFVRTAHLGGLIRHDELRTNTMVEPGGENQGEEEDDD